MVQTWVMCEKSMYHAGDGTRVACLQPEVIAYRAEVRKWIQGSSGIRTNYKTDLIN